MSVSVGDQLHCDRGEWQWSPNAYAYQWQRSSDGVTGWVEATVSTRSDYIVDSGDVGFYLRCVVTASNVSGSSGAVASDAIGPVGLSPPAPGGSVRRLNQYLILENA